jgi:hypothetical protein
MICHALWNGLVPPRNMASLIGQATIPLGDNKFCQGILDKITNF